MYPRNARRAIPDIILARKEPTQNFFHNPKHESHPRNARRAIPNIIPVRKGKTQNTQNQPRLPRVQRPAGLWSFFWERGVHEDAFKLCQPRMAD